MRLAAIVGAISTLAIAVAIAEDRTLGVLELRRVCQGAEMGCMAVDAMPVPWMSAEGRSLFVESNVVLRLWPISSIRAAGPLWGAEWAMVSASTSLVESATIQEDKIPTIVIGLTPQLKNSLKEIASADGEKRYAVMWRSHLVSEVLLPLPSEESSYLIIACGLKNEVLREIIDAYRLAADRNYMGE